MALGRIGNPSVTPILRESLQTEEEQVVRDYILETKRDFETLRK